MNGRDGTTAFLPLDSKIGGQISHDRKGNLPQWDSNPMPLVCQTQLSDRTFLTREQTNYVYKKVETGKMINTDTIQQEIEQEEQLNRIYDTNRETNPYQAIDDANGTVVNFKQCPKLYPT